MRFRSSNARQTETKEREKKRKKRTRETLFNELRACANSCRTREKAPYFDVFSRTIFEREHSSSPTSHYDSHQMPKTEEEKNIFLSINNDVCIEVFIYRNSNSHWLFIEYLTDRERAMSIIRCLIIHLIYLFFFIANHVLHLNDWKGRICTIARHRTLFISYFCFIEIKKKEGRKKRKKIFLLFLFETLKKKITTVFQFFFLFDWCVCFFCDEKKALSDKTWITICTCIICHFISIDINRMNFRSTTFVNNFTFRSNFIRLNGFFKKFIECFRYRSISTTILNRKRH